MRHKTVWFLSWVFVLGMAGLARADDPTSRFLPLSPLASSLPASSTGVAVQFEVWDQATDGTMIFAEAHTVDTDAGSGITNDTGFADLLLGRGVAGGLVPANFPAGSTRYLDVTQDGVSVLTARVPLYAWAFSISPGLQGPAGPKGDKGDKGDPGQPGPPGVVQAVSPGDPSIVVGGTATNPTVAVASNGITNGNVANGALSPAKIAGIAATLGANLFTGTQGINGNLNLSLGNLTMVNSTATAGNIVKGGVPFIHNFGFENTFTGSDAGNLTMSGGQNTATGFQALQSNTSGVSNTATGSRALQFNTTGFWNTATGWGALISNTTGFNNTATGFEALFRNTTGVNNTASGLNALSINTFGDRNTASGVDALRNNSTGSNNTASGVRALFSNTTSVNNTASGYEALFRNTTGDNNTASGYGALLNNTTGNSNTAVGSFADVSVQDLDNATAIGSGAIVNASNKIRLGNSDVTVIEGQVAYTFTSDKTKKQNLQPVEGEEVLRKIGGLTLTSWNYIGHDPKQFRHYGPVAQEFFAAFGHDGVGTIGTETTINSGDMEGILMIAVQALEKRTRELDAWKADNAGLKAENARLAARIEKLERSIGSYVLTAKAE